MKKKLLKIENIYLTSMIVFICLSISCSGIISIIAHRLNFDFLNLWKELGVSIITFLALLLVIKKKERKLIKIFIAITITIILYFLLTIVRGYPVVIPIYQIKMDGFTFMFIFDCFVFHSIASNVDGKQYYRKIINFIIIVGVINSIVIILQRYFPEFYFEKIVGVTWGNYGHHGGITLYTTLGKFRAVGIFTSFTVAGDFMYIAILLLMETKNKFTRKKIKFTLLVLFLVASIFTMYKNVMLGLIFYGLLKFVRFIGNKKNIRNINAAIVAIIVSIFSMLYIVSTTLLLYPIIESLFGKLAYNSIFLRVQFHKSIFNLLNGIFGNIFGAGMGVYGTYGLDKTQFGIEKIPLDSGFVYVLSNYGYLGIFIMLFAFIYILYRVNKSDVEYKYLALYIVSYLLCIEMFFNNFIMNIPVPYLLIGILTKFIYDDYHKNNKPRKDGDDLFKKTVVFNALQSSLSGGIGRYCIELSKQIYKLKDDLDFKIVIREEDKKRYSDIREEDLIIIKNIDNGIKRNFYEQFILPYKIKREFKDAIIHYPDTMAPLLADNEIVTTMHDVAFRSLKNEFSLKTRLWKNISTSLSVKKVKKIISITEFTKSEIINYYDNVKDKINVVYNGFNDFSKEDIDDTKVRKEIKEIKDRYILSVNTITPRKNIDSIIKCFNEIKKIEANDDVKLVIAGGKGYKADEILAYIKEYNLQEEVIITGRINDDELKYLYKNSSVYIYISLYEGFGLSPLEAISFGIPTLVSNVTSIPEVVGDKAILVNPKDVLEISEGLDKLLNNKMFLKSLKKKMECESNRFNWEECANNTIEVYKNIFKERGI